MPMRVLISEMQFILKAEKRGKLPSAKPHKIKNRKKNSETQKNTTFLIQKQGQLPYILLLLLL